uniref:Uncharacterized protein n=1 Tax=Arion vulgaris TaxID=1028688 RepID=A0A0B7BW97_9EUPU
MYISFHFSLQYRTTTTFDLLEEILSEDIAYSDSAGFDSNVLYIMCVSKMGYHNR